MQADYAPEKVKEREGRPTGKDQACECAQKRAENSQCKLAESKVEPCLNEVSHSLQTGNSIHEHERGGVWAGLRHRDEEHSVLKDQRVRWS